MNAVMHKYDMTEDADMPANEDNNLELQVAVLGSDVRHIQSDVTDIKADLRAFRKETGDRFDKIDQRFERVDQKLDSTKKEIGEVKDSSVEQIREVKDSLASAKIWALGLYFALAGSLLYVLARGFKWL
jgi:ElaB/YqjD/DUF883 family membrane-anchored ribosome-binding protein